MPQPATRGRIRSWNNIAVAETPAPSVAVRMAEVTSDPQLAGRRHSPLRESQARMLFLHLQLEGESINRQDHRNAHLKPGDFTICDNSRPFDIEFWQPIRMLVVSLPDDLIRRYLQYPQRVTALPIAGSRGVGGVVSEFLVSVWHRCMNEKEFDVDPAVADALLGLLAHAYRQALGPVVDRNSLADAHRDRVNRFIEENLGDPNLTPTHIARSFRITTRYLHHLFSHEKETIARYILRRRLEDCARALTAPASRQRTITAIAFDHGFNSATHFGRVFRTRYKLTPREYRQRFSYGS